MLQRDTQTSEYGSHSPDTGQGRSIDAILARREARLKERRSEYAPDFMHGRVSLDVGYDDLGERWMENTVFVEYIRDESGTIQAWTVGWFQDRFLTIEQGVRGESEDFEERLARRLDSRRTVVRLELDGTPTSERAGEIAIGSTLARFVELEREELGVVRDSELADRGRLVDLRGDVLGDSETTMMSLVCLCALLAR